MNNYNLVFHKWVEVILYIYNFGEDDGKKFPSQIAKELDITYSHIVKIITGLEKRKIINSTKTGRVRKVELTKKGNELAYHLFEAKRRL